MRTHVVPDNTYLFLIAWRVITAFEERGGLSDADVAALRELVVEHQTGGPR